MHTPRSRTARSFLLLAAVGAGLAAPWASSPARSAPVDVELGPAEVSLRSLGPIPAAPALQGATGSPGPSSASSTSPESTGVLAPSSASAPGAAAGTASSASATTPSALALDPTIPARGLVQLRKGVEAPSEVDLLNELGVRAGPRTEASTELLSRYVARDLAPAERLAYVRSCESLVGQNTRSFPIDEKSLACVPWALERIAADRAASRSKAGDTPNEPLRSARTKELWAELEGVPFAKAFPRVDALNLRDLKALRELAAATRDDCRYVGATAGVIARAETFLPEEEAFATIEELYPGAFRCLEPDVDGFERTHMRVGLLRLLRGETAKAKQSLLLAAHAEDPQEDFRAWFWLGVIADGEKARGESPTDGASYWAELRRRYPITIHSVLAAHAMGEDPLDTFRKDAPVHMARRAGDAWSEYNRASLVFELLLARGDSKALGEWSRFVARALETPNPQATLFWAWCHHRVKNHRASISLLSRYLKETQGGGVNLEILNMMFPRAYSDEIVSHADGVDPVLVFALIRQESAFDPQARSVADARGLMQLLPSTARKWLRHPHEELYDPSLNVRTGVQYMQHLLRRYDGNVEHVLAAYNAGSGNLDKWRKRFPKAGTLLFSDLIPFKETRTYVAIIQRNAYWYGRLMVLQNDGLAKTMQAKSQAARWRSETVHHLLAVAWGRRAGDAVASLGPLYSVRSDGRGSRSTGVPPSGASGLSSPSSAPAVPRDARNETPEASPRDGLRDESRDGQDAPVPLGPSSARND